MPRIFVPGPSVNPSIGSPAEFIKQIANTTNRFRENAQRDTLLENNKLFRDRTADLAERSQAFTEAEPERARAEAQFLRDQANADAKLYLEATQGAGGSILPQFLSRPEVQADFSKLGISNPDEQAAYVKQIPEFRALFSNPTRAGNTALEARIASGGSLEQGQKAQQGAIDSIFGAQLDPKLAAEVMKQRNASSNALIGGLFKGINGTGKSGTPVQSAPSQQAEEELRDTLTGRMKISDARGGGVVDTVAGWFGIGDPTRSTWDVGMRNLDQADVDRVVGTYGDRYPQHAIVGGMRSIVDPDDGTIDQKKWQNILNDPESKDAAAFETEVENWQKKAERTRGGTTSPIAGLSAREIFSLADGLQRSQDARNTDIIRRTSPQEATFESRLAAFRSLTGQPSAATAPTADTPRQGPGGGGNSNTSGTGSAGLDSLINPAGVQEGNSPGTPADINTPDQIFPNTAPPGTAPPVVDNQLFNSAVADNPNLPGLIAAANGGPAPISQGPVSPNDANKIFTAQNAAFERDSAATKQTSTQKDEESLQSLIARTTPPTDLRDMSSRERSVGLTEAKKLLAAGVISRDDAPSGGTLNDKLLIAYLQHINQNK